MSNVADHAGVIGRVSHYLEGRLALEASVGHLAGEAVRNGAGYAGQVEERKVGPAEAADVVAGAGLAISHSA